MHYGTTRVSFKGGGGGRKGATAPLGYFVPPPWKSWGLKYEMISLFMVNWLH